MQWACWRQPINDGSSRKICGYGSFNHSAFVFQCHIYEPDMYNPHLSVKMWSNSFLCLPWPCRRTYHENRFIVHSRFRNVWLSNGMNVNMEGKNAPRTPPEHFGLSVWANPIGSRPCTPTYSPSAMAPFINNLNLSCWDFYTESKHNVSIWFLYEHKCFILSIKLFAITFFL